MAETKQDKRSGNTPATGLSVRLAASDRSDQPVLANFTRLNGAPGMVFIDFGFLEPAALATLSRLARAGGKIPESLNGRLAVRVALGYDTLAGLHQQLGQALAGLEARGAGVRAKGGEGSAGA